MEYSPFSQYGLQEDVLNKEIGKEYKFIENTKDAIEKEVDFHAIADIIKDLIIKSKPGISESEIKEELSRLHNVKIEVKYVLHDEDDISYHGSANTDGNYINYSAFALCDSKGIPDTESLIYVSIHELLHVATGSFGLSGDNYKTGIEEQKNIKGEQVTFFTLANEGLTELITSAIYSEYVARRKGLGGVKQKIDLNDTGKVLIEKDMSYIKERIAMMNLIKHISFLTGFTNEEVCRSFVSLYITKGSLLEEDLIDEFKEYPEVLETIEAFKRNLIAEISINEEQDYINKYIESLDLFAKALFGRDVIGEYNIKTIDEIVNQNNQRIL